MMIACVLCEMRRFASLVDFFGVIVGVICCLLCVVVNFAVVIYWLFI